MVTPHEYSDEARVALRTMVAEHGPDVLSRPTAVSNLLKDLLPDAPRVARMLVAAAEDHIADSLRDHVAQGMDVATAARLTTSFFASATLYPPDACAWVVGEMAVALGLLTVADGPPTVIAAEGSGGSPALANPPAPEPATAAATQAPAFEAEPPTRRATRVLAYVACESDSTVTPVDLLARTAGAAIRTGSWPRAIAVTPDRATALVVNYGDGTLTPIAIASGTAGPAIKAGNGPVAIAITGGTALIASEGDDAVTPVSLATRTPGQPIRVGKRPYAIAVDPRGAVAFVANQGDGTVTPITLGSGGGSVAHSPIAVGNGPAAIAITPDGTTAYVANHRDGTVTPISLSTGLAGLPIPVGKRPVAIAITADGRAAYVANHGDGTVTPIMLPPPAFAATHRPLPQAPIPVGRRPWGIALTADGTAAYVANYGDGTVTPIDLTTGVPAPPIAVSKRPWAIALIS